MSTLSDYIKAQPEKSRREWAECFGISRPYLYSLIDGTRNPSVAVASRIAEATDHAVPVSAWPNMSAVLSAARPHRRRKTASQRGAA